MEIVQTRHVAILAWMGMVAHQERDLEEEVPEAGPADEDLLDAMAYASKQRRGTFLAAEDAE
jgi:hypothetical protein